jgi:hypothetical protein
MKRVAISGKKRRAFFSPAMFVTKLSIRSMMASPRL